MSRQKEISSGEIIVYVVYILYIVFPFSGRNGPFIKKNPHHALIYIVHVHNFGLSLNFIWSNFIKE